MDHWRPILHMARERLPRLRRVSCYAMARNVAAKTDAELAELKKTVEDASAELCRQLVSIREERAMRIRMHTAGTFRVTPEPLKVASAPS